MASDFNVSRATIWKAIKNAESMGIEIFSVPGRGYKLPSAIIFLEKNKVIEAIGSACDRFKIEIHPHLDSTNSYLMKRAEKDLPGGTCIAAEIQTNGKGRRGRPWQASLGASLTFSLLWRFECGPSALSGLSLAIGVAVIRTFRSLGLEHAELKWPNDILISYQSRYLKLSGILVELQGDMDGTTTAVIGVGVNLDLPDIIKNKIDQPFIDWKTAANSKIDPNQLLGALLKNMGEILDSFVAIGFDGLKEEWSTYHAYHNRDVRLIFADNTELQGVVTGVGGDGFLFVNTHEGIKRFMTGEISLREVGY